MQVKWVRTSYITITFMVLFIAVSQPSWAVNRKFLGFKSDKESSHLPQGWEVITYLRTNANKLSLTKEKDRTVVMMKSIGSASALLKRIQVDPNEFPWLVWCWKVDRAVGMAIEEDTERSDSSARVRVIFAKKEYKPSWLHTWIVEFINNLDLSIFHREPSGFKIDYIWGNNLSPGEVIHYPDSKNHKIVIVESGNKKSNQWIWEKRNLVEDCKQFFGGLPLSLIGVVVLTDTDQTNEGVNAYYSSIVLINE